MNKTLCKAKQKIVAKKIKPGKHQLKAKTNKTVAKRKNKYQKGKSS